MTSPTPHDSAVALELEPRQQAFLNLLQTSIPIAAHPYRDVAAAVGMTESEALATLRRLRETRVIRQVSAIFDSRALGYASSLVAARCASTRLDQAAAVVSGHPGVSHNYRREHAYNLWYTLAVPPTSRLGIEGTAEILHRMSGAETTRLLPALRVFKIGVQLDMTGESHPGDRAAGTLLGAAAVPPPPLTALEIAAVRELQHDLPDDAEPFRGACARLGLNLDELAALATQMQSDGRLRRIAAVLNHRRAGFTANAMGVWRVDPERIEEAGARMASFRAVSHCYQRPTYPDWPYNLFTMVHGRGRAECDEALAAIQRELQLPDYLALYSVQEYKKARMTYFSPEAEQWEEAQLAGRS